MSDPIPTIVYPPGLSEPVIIPRQLTEIRLPESRPSSRLARSVHGAICAGVVAGQRPRGRSVPPVEEWPAEAFDRLMAAVREVPAGRFRRAWWLAKQHVRAAVGR